MAKKIPHEYIKRPCFGERVPFNHLGGSADIIVEIQELQREEGGTERARAHIHERERARVRARERESEREREREEGDRHTHTPN